MFDQTPRCCSCRRFKPSDVVYLNLGDGRKICCDCYSTAIMDKSTCEELWLEVRTFFKKLNLDVEKCVPCYLIDKKEMHKLVRPAIHSTGEVLGVTTTYNSQTIMIIDKFSLEGGKIEVAMQLSSERHLISVLILFGYPRVVTGSIMAHEMMHAWMRMKGYAYEPRVEEGMCQVFAHMWLDCFEDGDEGSSSGASDTGSYIRNLKNFHKNECEMNYTESYGDGFRDAKFAVEKYGLKYILDYIAKTGSLPQS